MVQIISSAIMNAPPGHQVVKMLLRTNWARECGLSCVHGLTPLVAVRGVEACAVLASLLSQCSKLLSSPSPAAASRLGGVQGEWMSGRKRRW